MILGHSRCILHGKANALHIFFNLFFQMRFGFGMEKQFGRRKFCLLYMFCGFLGNLISVALDPMKLAVGASTSGFGLLGVWAAEVLLTWELLGESRARIFLWFAFMQLGDEKTPRRCTLYAFTIIILITISYYVFVIYII